MKWLILTVMVTTVICAPMDDITNAPIKKSDDREARTVSDDNSKIMQISVKMINDEVAKTLHKKEFRAIKDFDSNDEPDDPVIMIKNRPQYQEINRKSKEVKDTKDSAASTTPQFIVSTTAQSIVSSTSQSNEATTVTPTVSTSAKSILSSTVQPTVVTTTTSTIKPTVSTTAEPTTESSTVKSSTVAESTTKFVWNALKSTTETIPLVSSTPLHSDAPIKNTDDSSVSDDNLKAKVVKDTELKAKDISKENEKPEEEKPDRRVPHRGTGEIKSNQGDKSQENEKPEKVNRGRTHYGSKPNTETQSKAAANEDVKVEEEYRGRHRGQFTEPEARRQQDRLGDDSNNENQRRNYDYSRQLNQYDDGKYVPDRWNQNRGRKSQSGRIADNESRVKDEEEKPEEEYRGRDINVGQDRGRQSVSRTDDFRGRNYDFSRLLNRQRSDSNDDAQPEDGYRGRNYNSGRFAAPDSGSKVTPKEDDIQDEKAQTRGFVRGKISDSSNGEIEYETKKTEPKEEDTPGRNVNRGRWTNINYNSRDESRRRGSIREKSTTEEPNYPKEQPVNKTEEDTSKNNNISKVPETTEKAKKNDEGKPSGMDYKNIKITDSDMSLSDNGKFHYSYETDHGLIASQQGELREMREDQMGQAVQGGFSYLDDNGETISLSYTADENGYRPVGDHLPTPPPIPEAIARALELLATKEPTVDYWSAEEYIEKMLLNNPRKHRKVKGEKTDKKSTKLDTKKSKVKNDDDDYYKRRPTNVDYD